MPVSDMLSLKTLDLFLSTDGTNGCAVVVVFGLKKYLFVTLTKILRNLGECVNLTD